MAISAVKPHRSATPLNSQRIAVMTSKPLRRQRATVRIPYTPKVAQLPVGPYANPVLVRISHPDPAVQAEALELFKKLLNRTYHTETKWKFAPTVPAEIAAAPDFGIASEAMNLRIRQVTACAPAPTLG